MKKTLLIYIAFICFCSCAFSQVSEIECTVYRRGGAYITITPAHYNESLLPKPGSSVYLFLYVNSNLPEGKSEGYYQMCSMQTIKIASEIKSITFKMDEDMDVIRTRTGLPDILIVKGSRVKISWSQ